MPVPIQPGTQTRGGVYQDSVMRCTSTIVPIYLPQRGLSVIARPARSDPAEKGRTGAPPPLFRGRSRPIYPYGKVPNTYPKRALTRRRQAP